MKKEEIRREAIKLRFKYKFYIRIQRILVERYDFSRVPGLRLETYYN